MLLESPLSHARVVLHDWRGTALAAALVKAHDGLTVATSIPGVSGEETAGFLRLLSGVGMLSQVEEDGRPAEDDHPALALWEFPDLLFHTRSRQGRHANPHGGTYRFEGRLSPLPAVKPRMSEDVVSLARPDLGQLMTEDMPLTAVLEQRRSVRAYGEKPITAEQLGHFLYRTFRLKRLLPTDKQELCSRPYPSGGAIYELELYAAVRECNGLAPGLYHYDPAGHQLGKLTERTPLVDGLLRGAWWSNGGQCVPQVLLVLAARFPRMMWKYQGMAYAAILKHVGVVYQTMYLVATAMGLAPCALGSGNSDVFAQAAGPDYYAETSVGEFMLGSRRPLEEAGSPANPVRTGE
jgi:SagB-type dehydrogenase family enzyme